MPTPDPVAEISSAFMEPLPMIILGFVILLALRFAIERWVSKTFPRKSRRSRRR